jgi:hypothetical protein
MGSRIARILLPQDLIEEIDSLVGRGSGTC